MRRRVKKIKKSRFGGVLPAAAVLLGLAVLAGLLRRRRR